MRTGLTTRSTADLREYFPFSDRFPVLREWFRTRRISPRPGPESGGSAGSRWAPDLLRRLFPTFPEPADQGADLRQRHQRLWFGTTAEPYQHLSMTLARGIEFRRPSSARPIPASPRRCGGRDAAGSLPVARGVDRPVRNPLQERTLFHLLPGVRISARARGSLAGGGSSLRREKRKAKEPKSDVKKAAPFGPGSPCVVPAAGYIAASSLNGPPPAPAAEASCSHHRAGP